MRCPNCDRENRDVARFCQYCGASLAAAEPPDALDQGAQISEMERSSELPAEQMPASPDLSAKDVPQAPESIADQAAAESSVMSDLVDQPEAALAPMLEGQEFDIEPPDVDPAVEDDEMLSVEPATEVTPEKLSPAQDDDPGQDDPTLTEPHEEPSPDVDAADEGAALPLAQGDIAGEQEPDVDGREAECAASEEWEAEIDQEPEPTSLNPAELEPIAPQASASDASPAAGEPVEPDEPLAEVEELAAAGLLPWDDRAEPTQAPFTALEPGSVVDGRYQVIEVLQIEEQEARYRVRDLAQCPRCGSADNSPDQVYCVSCGAQMGQKPVAMMLERAAPGDGEPDEAQASEYLEHKNRHYWVWQEMEQEPMNNVQPPMRLTVGQLSDTGQVRELDEDSLFVLAMSSTYKSLIHQLGLFVVADGMGGHEGGEVASRIAIQRLVQSLLRDVFAPELAGNPLTENAILDHLESAVRAANDRVYLERQKRENDMGTTLTVALVIDWVLYLAHVGDCRAYRWGQDGLQQLTADHSIVAGMVAAGTIPPEEIYTHPQRSVIYRSIGDRPTVEVDLGTLSLGPDDRLVLCCDGLWEMIRSEGIEDVLLQESDPQAACEVMVEQANRAGGSDNISVIIVQF